MDWNDICEELLDSILSNVLGKDRYSFSLVCHSWNRVVKASPYRPSPTLMTFNKRNCKCFQHNGFFRMNFPTLLKNAVVRFANDGWLLMMSSDTKNLFFFDPFNNQTIELPPLPDSNCTTKNTICFVHPPTSPDCRIIGILSILENDVKIGVVLKYGQDRWNRRVLPGMDREFKISFGPPVLHDGKVYFLDVKGNVARFDMRDDIWSFDIFRNCLTNPRVRRNIKERFLIKPKNEETVFAVFILHGKRKVRVFEFTNEHKWKLVENLHNRVFYVSKTSSFGYTTEDKSMANKIFFPKFHDGSVVFYSMDTQKYHSFEGDYSSNDCNDFTRFDLATWMIPILRSPQLPRVPRELTWCKKLDETQIN